MSKAEDKAKELYPDWELTSNPKLDGQEQSNVRIQRQAFLKGYHQAEKDNELTWENISDIDDLLDESLLSSFGDELELKGYYEEVLKRFKDLKNGTTKR